MASGLGLPRHAQRHAIAGAVMLFMIMAGHTVLETARDSLFLARMPIAQLPWAYALIAVAALVGADLDRRLRTRIAPRNVLSLTLVGGALGCALLTLAFRAHAGFAPHAFYVWVGLVASMVVSQFWLLLSELFAVAEAKRVYSIIAAGGLVGGGVGGALARIWVSEHQSDSTLPLLGAGLLAVAAAMPGLRTPQLPMSRPSTPPHPMRATSSAALRDLRSERYLSRLLGLALVSTISVTLVDYLFKAEVVRTVPPAELSRFFGTFSAALSAVAVLAQLLLAPRLLQILGVGRSLLILPSALSIATVSALLAPGLFAFGVLRGIDTALRHSLQRSALEVLYLPLTTQARARWKLVVEVLGQRGGQALSAFAMLGWLALGLPVAGLLGLCLLGCALWLLLARSMERNYLELFREKIRAGSIETRPEVPGLDMRSLESLVAGLGSDDDDEVLAAIDLLANYDRPHAISSLLLYHPSRTIVLRALEVLTSSGRRDFAGAARRLLTRDDDEIRASAMLALAGQLDEDELRAELDAASSTAARAALLIASHARGLDDHGRLNAEIEQAIAPEAELESRLAFARALRLCGDTCCAPFVARLAQAAEPALAHELVHAMAAVPDASYLPWLIRALPNRALRQPARDALRAIGAPALQALARASEDEALPRNVRAHLPRTLAIFGSQAAAESLLDWLEREPDGWVRFKLIRALGLLRPHLRTRPLTLRVQAQARATLGRVVHFMSLRLENEVDRLVDARLDTQCGELLIAVLRQKEAHALDRAVRIVGLSHSASSIHSIRQSLGHRDRRFRSDGIELLVHKAPEDIGKALAALLDFGPDHERLGRAAEVLGHSLPKRSYEDRLALLLADDSEAVRSVAACHVGELGLVSMADAVADAEASSTGMASDVFARVRAQLASTKSAPRRLGRTLHEAASVEASGGA